MESHSETITVREAATVLGVSVQHVHRLIESGTLKVARQLPGVTGAKLIKRDAVNKLVAERAS